MGGGGPTSTSSGSSNPVLYNWKDILPPWVQGGQQAVLPWLMSRASEGGMLPSEERALWSQARGTVEQNANQATKNLSRQLATSGLAPSSPMAAGAFADLGLDKNTAMTKAAMDFAKLKMGARDTAIGQLLTALYTPPPVAVGQYSQQVQQSGGGGGGK